MVTLILPTYIPNIETFTVIAQNEVCWEVCDNFQKQTYRNRAYICTDRGKLMLNIPIRHIGKKQGHQKYNEIKIENDYNWQRQHWRTLQTAYRSSPYFEFYEDEIAPLYTQEYEYLMDYNLMSIKIICECLQIDTPKEKNEMFELHPKDLDDFRFLATAKRQVTLKQNAYNQVFSNRHGFIENVSILDLLFNEGTHALSYLKNLNSNDINA
ncbi:FIG00649844: hypothetical protein [hydrothermal vent metagenome]|uniref:WbqC-like protein n=1 Tax=hydrothermal vent metagenome TaxID=652676 RepID=A0A3B0TJM3_9ZZZZ